MCYAVPVAGAVITSFLCRKGKSAKLFWLNLMFLGGALFGVIDHLWNNELFLISQNWPKDMLLGVVITIGIVSAWGIILTAAKKNRALIPAVK